MFGELMSLRRASAPAPSDNAPFFPLYLLPTLRIPFRRRRATEPSLSPPTGFSSLPSTAPSLSSSPLSPISPTISHLQNPTTRRLSRTQPATLRCRTCSTDLAFHDQIVSKGFMGRHGRAYLVSPPAAPARPNCPRPPLDDNTEGEGASPLAPTDLVNVRVGRAEDRLLVTGAHVVADIRCVGCGAVVGWKYVDARDPGQRYKVGKFILETRKVVGFHSWEDIDVPSVGDEGVHRPLCGPEEEGEVGNNQSIIVFDSDDEDECEDIFTAVWDPKVVAQRRKNKVVNMVRDGGRLV
ncbi:yippee-domain-containing protein [Trichocladium antarcticum]|uniref:Yippee-domain-containing protein n=1 Tax=Trichocladium antarcticum TaxID=1450529 RepID=A0AAN6UTN2_9PEZI|nr:yippee-domain-containing protein [Trichocladium antarcticum]